MSAYDVLWIVALVTVTWQCAIGGSTLRQFQPGDYVEVMDGTSWQTCMVSGQYRQASRDYPVSCGTKELFVSSGPTHIRSRKPTAEEVRMTAETTAALARLPQRLGKGRSELGLARRSPPVPRSRVRHRIGARYPIGDQRDRDSGRQRSGQVRSRL